jgi:hypothetical protein
MACSLIQLHCPVSHVVSKPVPICNPWSLWSLPSLQELYRIEVGHLRCPCRNPWSFSFKSDKAAHHIKDRFKQSANSLIALPLLVSSNQQHLIKEMLHTVPKKMNSQLTLGEHLSKCGSNWTLGPSLVSPRLPAPTYHDLVS